MTHLFLDLTNAERTELLEALRRDMRQQDRLAESNNEWASWHAYNARAVKRILECLNPKTVHAASSSNMSGHSRAKLLSRTSSTKSSLENVETSEVTM
jgi:hypothetical protein